jgi:oxalate decarboxylase/phosphoglucose isomerase-like protein (cupin superfamily)
VGYESDFHCTEQPQWIVILKGCMEIILQDGSTRQFMHGDYFFCADVLPAGATFDPKIHGHRSRQCGDEVLQTMFIKA